MAHSRTEESEHVGGIGVLVQPDCLWGCWKVNLGCMLTGAACQKKRSNFFSEKRDTPMAEKIILK